MTSFLRLNIWNGDLKNVECKRLYISLLAATFFFSTHTENSFKVIPHICIAHPYCTSLLRIIYGVISALVHAHIENMTDLPWYWALSLSWKMALAHKRARAPQFFSSHCNQLIIRFTWEKTDLISIAENWINKKNSRHTVVFSILQSVTTSRNLVQIFNQGFSFQSESNLKCLFVFDTMHWL